MSLDRFSPPVRAWFEDSFGAPTAPQEKGWPAIADGDHTLIFSPTGSGKTLSAFLWGIDTLITDPTPEDDPHTRIVYVSPLRALAVDVDKNLRAPLAGITNAALRMGMTTAEPTVGVRTGDTTAQQRRQIARRPPDILITTPESLYLMMTSRAREGLTRVRAVIIDEIHALAGTKRGTHLSLTLERLTARCESPPQRIGLSATQRPLEETARFLGGRDVTTRSWRPVTIIDAGATKEFDIQIVVPLEDMASVSQPAPKAGPDHRSGQQPDQRARSIWPSMHPRLLELINSHQSTLVFVNARRMSERLATQLNELAANESAAQELAADVGMQTATHDDEPADLVLAHHGSLSRERRVGIEEQLKAGELAGLVATSSLELGIDMGAVDLVIQVESPGAVSRGLQRIGRAGHNVGDISRGRIFPKHRADLLEATVVVQRMLAGQIESTHYLRNPLDVLAQQIVAMCAMDDWTVKDLSAVIRGSANYAEISDEVLVTVLDLLAGRYPSDAFAELRPRIVWDRIDDTLRGRRGAQRLAVTNPGTIPDRGLFGVFLPDGTRVGELDEEMVHESRPGEVFLLGASSWRIEEITFERVIVTPAPGEPGRMPFWRGDGPGRPIELGVAIGEFTRELLERDKPATWLQETIGLDRLAAANLLQYLRDQATATGAIPDDRTIVVERFPDEIGDTRVCVHTPFGAQVHAPWAMALRGRLNEQLGTDVEMLWSDDGIVLRLPEHIDNIPLEALTIDPVDIERLVVDELPKSAMFASRFREAAGRALLLPRRRPGQRTPLWQQRQRAADLLEAAQEHAEFPIVLETIRECINDVFDLPALRQVLEDIQNGQVQVVTANTQKASPFAQSLLFSWVAVYMYEGDAPAAERRATALSLDRELLQELLGTAELRELLDAEVVELVERELQRLTENRAARDADELHDVLRQLGPLTPSEIEARVAEPAQAATWVKALIDDRRAFEVPIAGSDHLAATEDAGRLRDALNTVLPEGLPEALTESVNEPAAGLLRRFARTHGPFTTEQVAHRFGVSAAIIAETLRQLEDQGIVTAGEFRPGGTGPEWCDQSVLRQLRRRSLAALRAEVQPVPPQALARFLPRWQGVGVARRGIDGLVEVLATLQGAPIALSVLERHVLPIRMHEYRPADLDALCTSGEVVWVGDGSVGSNDGRIKLVFRDQARLLLPSGSPEDGPGEPHHQAIRDHLAARGASFWTDLVQACADAEVDYGESAVLEALWDLVWAGEVTNDSLAPLRARLAARPAKRAKASRRRPRPGRLSATGPPTAAGRWSLVAPLLEPRPTPTQAMHARAIQLLERYGVLTREAALGEGSEGGFAGVYPLLKVLEEQGKVRRGYFVTGLGAAQFSMTGAVDRLRQRSTSPAARAAFVIAATDPGQPFGASLDWPQSTGRPARRVGATVVLAEGEPLVFVDASGKTLLTFPAAETRHDWAKALAEAVDDGRLQLEISQINGEAPGQSEHLAALEQAGFGRGYKGWTRQRMT